MSWADSKERTRVAVYEGRRALLAQLGGKCEKCGTKGRGKNHLEFDHPHGRDYEPSKLARHNRLAAYRRDAAAGNLRVLCRHCNRAEGRARWRTGLGAKVRRTSP